MVDSAAEDAVPMRKTLQRALLLALVVACGQEDRPQLLRVTYYYLPG